MRGARPSRRVCVTVAGPASCPRSCSGAPRSDVPPIAIWDRPGESPLGVNSYGPEANSSLLTLRHGGSPSVRQAAFSADDAPWSACRWASLDEPILGFADSLHRLEAAVRDALPIAGPVARASAPVQEGVRGFRACPQRQLRRVCLCLTWIEHVSPARCGHRRDQPSSDLTVRRCRPAPMGQYGLSVSGPSSRNPLATPRRSPARARCADSAGCHNQSTSRRSA